MHILTTVPLSNLLLTTLRCQLSANSRAAAARLISTTYFFLSAISSCAPTLSLSLYLSLSRTSLSVYLSSLSLSLSPYRPLCQAFVLISDNHARSLGLGFCVPVRRDAYLPTAHTHTHVYAYVNACLCVCVCIHTESKLLHASRCSLETF